MKSSVEIPDMITSANTPSDVSSLGAPRGPTAHQLPSTARQLSTALRFLLKERVALVRRSDWHRRRAERYALWSIGFGLVTTVVIVATFMSCHVPVPWWTKLLTATFAVPLGALSRFFQNRYKEDLRELERLRERIVQTADGV
jgi:hypothetical protein